MKKKILFVCNDEQTIISINNIFSNEYDLYICQTVSNAVSVLFRDHTNLSTILITSSDNYINENQLLKQIHTNPFFSQIPTFILYHSIDEQTLQSIMNFGVNGCLKLDLKPTILLKYIENAIRIKEKAAFSNVFRRETKAIEEMKTSYNLLDDSSSSVVVIDNKSYEIMYVNNTCSKMFSKEKDAIIGRKCYKFLKGKDFPCENCSMNLANDNDYIEYEYNDERSSRSFSIKSKLINWKDKKSLVCYISDETNSIKLRMKLQSSYSAIEAASRNTGISFWRYDIDNKVAEWSEFGRNNYIGYPLKMLNIPDSMIENKYVHPDDSYIFKKMYDELSEGYRTTECTVRLLDLSTNRYSSYHTVYTLLDDPINHTKQAIGFAENVDSLVEYQFQYNKELSLRNDLVKNTILYYEMDLNDNIIIEYQTKINDLPSLKSNEKISKNVKQDILNRVYKDDIEYVQNNLFPSSLLKTYKEGKTNIELLYRRYIKDDLRWVKTTIKIIKNEHNGHILAFVCLYDINDSEVDRIALSTAVSESIESMSIINIKSGMAHLIKASKNIKELQGALSFDHNEIISEIVRNNVIDDDKEKCLEFFDLNYLINTLNKNSSANISYTVIENNERKKKRSTAFYLSDLHNHILLVKRDITNLYEEDQRQKILLKVAADAANEANKAKGDFLSRMSHDMRTPMNAIIGMTYLAKQEKTSEIVSDYLNNIDISSRYLLGLINDVLDLSKIESGKTNLKEEVFAIDEFTKGINTVIKPLMDSKNIEFVFENNCKIKNIIVDKLRFNQIFFNLLNNAAKYTNNNGRVSMTFNHIKNVDRLYGLQCIIKDTGIGMSEEFLRIIFTPFTQENNSSFSEQQGTGLGLAIVKNLVDLMGGTISVESKLNEGTTFTINLYVKTTRNYTYVNEKINLDYSILNNSHILLVDDNNLNIIIAKKILEKVGCIITTATNGKEALETFEKSKYEFFDAILMDIKMDVMNGLEATKRIRALSRYDSKCVPIIAMTANVYSEDIESTKKAGMDAHLSKPIEPTLMYDTLVKHINKRHYN